MRHSLSLSLFMCGCMHRILKIPVQEIPPPHELHCTILKILILDFIFQIVLSSNHSNCPLIIPFLHIPAHHPYNPQIPPPTKHNEHIPWKNELKHHTVLCHNQLAANTQKQQKNRKTST